MDGHRARMVIGNGAVVHSDVLGEPVVLGARIGEKPPIVLKVNSWAVTWLQPIDTLPKPGHYRCNHPKWGSLWIPCEVFDNAGVLCVRLNGTDSAVAIDELPGIQFEPAP